MMLLQPCLTVKTVLATVTDHCRQGCNNKHKGKSQFGSVQAQNKLDQVQENIIVWVKVSTLLRLDDLHHYSYNNKHAEERKNNDSHFEKRNRTAVPHVKVMCFVDLSIHPDVLPRQSSCIYIAQFKHRGREKVDFVALYVMRVYFIAPVSVTATRGHLK